MRYSLRVILGAILIAGTSISYAGGEARTVTVTGSGHVSTPPDTAVVQTGIVTHGKSAAEALAQNNDAMVKMMEVLDRHGIPARAVQTSSFGVQPEFHFEPRQQPRRIIGYRVNNIVVVKVRDISSLGRILDALVQAGSNQISGVQFTVHDVRKLEEAARANAVQDAIARARQYAESAGVKLGAVIHIAEGTTQMPTPRMLQGMAVSEASASVPISTGEQEIRATISMVFGIDE